MNGPTVEQIEMLSFCPAHKWCFWLTVRLPTIANKDGWKFATISKWHGIPNPTYWMVFYSDLTTPTDNYVKWRSSTKSIEPWGVGIDDPREAALVVLAKAIELAPFTAGPSGVNEKLETWNLSVSGFEQLGVYIQNLFDVKAGLAKAGLAIAEHKLTAVEYEATLEPAESDGVDGLYPHTIVPKNARMPNRACQCEHYLNSHGMREEGGRWMCFVMTCNCESYRYRCPECNQISQRGMRHRIDCRTGLEHENAFRQLMGEPIQPALRLGIALEIAEP